MAVFNLGNIPQPNLDAFVLGNDDLTDLIHCAQFVEGTDNVLGFPLLDVASGQIDIFLHQPAGHQIEGDPCLSEEFLVQFDQDLLFKSPLDLGRGNTGNPFEIPGDLVFDYLSEIHQRNGAVADGDAQNGIQGGIVTENHGALDILFEKDLIEFLPYLLCRPIQIGPPDEFKDDVGLFRPGYRSDGIEILDQAELGFQRPRHDILHLFGGRSGVFGADGVCGIRNLRHEIPAHLRVTDETKQCNGQHHLCDGHRSLGGK